MQTRGATPETSARGAVDGGCVGLGTNPFMLSTLKKNARDGIVSGRLSKAAADGPAHEIDLL